MFLGRVVLVVVVDEEEGGDDDRSYGRGKRKGEGRKKTGGLSLIRRGKIVFSL